LDTANNSELPVTLITWHSPWGPASGLCSARRRRRGPRWWWWGATGAGSPCWCACGCR